MSNRFANVWACALSERERGREIERERVYQELHNGGTKIRAQQYQLALRQRVKILKTT
jgi:hypothetical protein